MILKQIIWHPRFCRPHQWGETLLSLPRPFRSQSRIVNHQIWLLALQWAPRLFLRRPAWAAIWFRLESLSLTNYVQWRLSYKGKFFEMDSIWFRFANLRELVKCLRKLQCEQELIHCPPLRQSQIIRNHNRRDTFNRQFIHFLSPFDSSLMKYSWLKP